MMIKFFNYFLLLTILLVTACTESSIAENAITGKLKLFLHKQEAVDLYVRFDLVEVLASPQADMSQPVNITSSGFKKISENPINFSLTYLPEKINQQKQYKFIATIVEDSQGEKEVSSMSIPVLTQGHPSNLNLAMQPLVDPIE